MDFVTARVELFKFVVFFQYYTYNKNFKFFFFEILNGLDYFNVNFMIFCASNIYNLNILWN